MKLVILESPYAGDIEANVEYARRAVRHSLSLGEAPIASHLLYTQPGILNDADPDERQWGIDAGLAWRTVAQASVVYTDRGISRGMQYGIDHAKAAGLPILERSIGHNWVPAPAMTDIKAEMIDDLRRRIHDAKTNYPWDRGRSDYCPMPWAVIEKLIDELEGK